MVLNKKHLFVAFPVAVFFILWSYVGADMKFFNEWEDASSHDISLIISKEQGLKDYSIAEDIIHDDVVLFLGMKVKEGERKGPVLLDQVTQVYSLNTKDKKVNFLIDLEDDVQYTFGGRTNNLNGVIYVSVDKKILGEKPGYNSLLYKMQVPSGKAVKIDTPKAVESLRFTPYFINQNRGWIIPKNRSVFFETNDGGGTWTERHLPPGYARLKGLDRFYSGSVVVQPATNDLFMSGHFPGGTNQPGNSPIYRLPADNTDVQGWQEVAALEGYDINDMAFLDNGDLLILAYEGDRPVSGSDLRRPQILRWDGDAFEHLADLGNRLLFRPQRNTNLRPNYVVTGQAGLVVINGRSFKNENGDLPVYNVTYVSHDYGRTWERLNNGVATGPVWFDQGSGYLFKSTPFSEYKKRL